jgi:hypothetical protein
VEIQSEKEIKFGDVSEKIFEATKDHILTLEKKEPDVKEFQDTVRNKMMEQMVYFNKIYI